MDVHAGAMITVFRLGSLLLPLTSASLVGSIHTTHVKTYNRLFCLCVVRCHGITNLKLTAASKRGQSSCIYHYTQLSIKLCLLTNLSQQVVTIH